MTISQVGKGTVATTDTGTLSFTGSAKVSGSEGDLLLLVVGMKPSTANGGTIGTPSGTGWSSVITAGGSNVGGYSTTLGADTGNCRSTWFRKTATGTDEADFTVALGTSNNGWGQLYRLSKTLQAWLINAVTANDTTGGSVSLGFGMPTGGIATGDYFLGSMVIPTDAATFSSPTLTRSGVTFSGTTIAEQIASSLGNDSGGFVVTSSASAGSSSSGTTTLAVTGGGTTTNIRGLGFLLRVREYTPKLFTSLIDTFTGGTRDTVKWPTVFGTVAQANNRFEGYDNIATIQSAHDYTWVGSSVLAQMTPPGGVGMAMTIAIDATSDFMQVVIDQANDVCMWRYAPGGVTSWSDFVTGGYDAVAHAWIRMRDDGAGTSYFDTSPDGLTWTNQFSRPTPALLDGNNNNYLQFTQNSDNGGTYSGTWWVDNVNNPPPPLDTGSGLLGFFR